jgi:hypothetical protein
MDEGPIESGGAKLDNFLYNQARDRYAFELAPFELAPTAGGGTATFSPYPYQEDTVAQMIKFYLLCGALENAKPGSWGQEARTALVKGFTGCGKGYFIFAFLANLEVIKRPMKGKIYKHA